MNENLPKRKNNRLQGFDYSSEGAFFLTICTQDRKKILSKIVGGDVLDAPNVELSEYGKIAEKYIKQISEFYQHIEVGSYVIMPNHIHLVLFVFGRDGASRTSPPTSKQHSKTARFVSTFKRFANKEYGKNIWQRGYNDHIIRNREDYEEHLRYIHENPLKWQFDELYTE